MEANRLLLLTHYSTCLGANNSMLNLILGLQRLGYVCHVVLPQAGPFSDKLAEQQIPHSFIPFYPNTYRPWHPSRFRVRSYDAHNRQTALAALATLREAYPYDWVYSNSSVFNMGALLAAHFDLPHLWHVRELAALFYGYAFYPSKAAVRAQLQAAHQLICISKTVEQYLQSYFEATLPTAVLFDAIHHKDPAAATPIPKQQPLTAPKLLTVGSLHPNKQHHVAIRAVAALRQQFPDIQLSIAGTGRPLYYWRLKLLIARLGLQRQVHLLGHVNDMPALYQAHDLVIMPSRGEGLGRVTLEAMLHQRLVIGYNHSGTAELLEHNERGLLYDDDAGLVAAIQQACTQPEQRQRILEQAQTWVLAHFHEDQYAQAFQTFLQ